MNEHGASEVGTATGVDYQEHLQTYNSFLRATRYGVAGIVILMILLTWWVY